MKPPSLALLTCVQPGYFPCKVFSLVERKQHLQKSGIVGNPYMVGTLYGKMGGASNYSPVSQLWQDTLKSALSRIFKLLKHSIIQNLFFFSSIWDLNAFYLAKKTKYH